MLRFLTAGESHGPELLLIVEGMPAGVPVSIEQLDHDLSRRQAGYGRGARSTKIERDHAQVVAGLANGRTTGAPVGVRIANRDFANQPPDPSPLTAPRPGHADLSGRFKYGHEDFRVVRERASARETAARVVAGGLARQLLGAFGAWVGSFVCEVGNVFADDRRLDSLDLLDEDALRELAAVSEADPFLCPDPEASARMREAVDEATERGETLGGAFWVVATSVPAGLGSYAHWDRRLDGRLAQAVCSIQAVKGVEIGRAFGLARARGSGAQDPIVWRGTRIGRSSNHAGGLEGGVSNGQPILVRAAMKPLPSVRVPVPTVDFSTGQEVAAPYVRTDVCAVPAAAVVGEAMVAWVLAHALVERFGGDRLELMQAAAQAAEATEHPAGLQPPVEMVVQRQDGKP